MAKVLEPAELDPATRRSINDALKQSSAANLVVEIGKLLFPVGAIYAATVSTNPGTLLGFGTWTAYGEGRVMVGKATSGTFATGGATGGAETVTIASGNLPTHTHDIDHNHAAFDSASAQIPSAKIVGFDTSADYPLFSTGGGSSPGYFGRPNTEFPNASGAGSTAWKVYGADTGHTHSIDVPPLGTTASGDGGFANTALNKLPPYIVTYLWQRTA